MIKDFLNRQFTDLALVGDTNKKSEPPMDDLSSKIAAQFEKEVTKPPPTANNFEFDF